MATASPGSSSSKPRTRHDSSNKISDLVGKGKEFDLSEVPSVRAVIQRGILIKEKLIIEQEVAPSEIKVGEIARQLAPLILDQWHKSNAKFCPPVIIQEKSLVNKIERLWKRVEDVAWGRVKKKEREKVIDMLDRLLDITTCPHPILLCEDTGSDCKKGKKDCKVQAHIQCTCLLPSKVPVMELRWLAIQRAKRGEKSNMMMGSNDKKESERQQKAAKRKTEEEEAKLKKEA